MKLRGLCANVTLTASSTLIGLLIINQALIYLANNNNQRHGFPRKYLTYFEPVARWKYPDYDNSDAKPDATFIVGDSYAEGAGDSFLNNAYNYSIAHFLDDNWRQNTNIYLTANSGSNIPLQLSLLKKHLRGELIPLSIPPKGFKNLNVILYFYEGNDLENTATSKLLPFQSWQSRLRLSFPIIYAKRIALGTLKNKFLKSKSKHLSPSSSNKNKICVGATCRSSPPMQSASAGLSEKQIFEEIDYLVDSINYFSLEYPKAKMCLIYIPSPSTIYSPKGEYYYQIYSVHQSNSNTTTNSTSNNSKSLLIRGTLQNRLNPNSITFIDATNDLKRESLKKFLHGTKDPKHFTAYGYRIVADATTKGCPID